MPSHVVLIQAGELEEILSGPGLVLVDCRSFAEYSKGHIPGAVNLDLFAFHWFDTTPAGMRAFGDQAGQLLSFAGIDLATAAAGGGGQRQKVVFYDDVSGMLAARGVWMLAYFSHPDASMLDGGITRWRSLGLATETCPNGFAAPRPPSRPPADNRTNPGVVAGYRYIRDNLGRDGLVIIDARSAGEYDGTVVRAAGAGHIPGAINVDWNRNIGGPDGMLKDGPSIERLYRIPRDSEVITYCQGAYRAANTFVALKTAGFENVRVYLGSWGEWGNRAGLPVER